MSWNPVLNIVKDIKTKYIDKFETISYDTKLAMDIDTGGRSTLSCLEQWIAELQIREYIDLIEPLQINQKDDLIIIRYGISGLDNLAGMWEDENSIYRECRSVVINVRKEELVVTPFKKFFNLNEVRENDEDRLGREINDAKVFEITNKLDGSMQSARFYDGEIRLFGSMALSEVDSWRIQQGYSLLTENHRQMLVQNPNLTFIFEYIGEINQHVVFYQGIDELVLIGIRSVVNGREYSYAEVKDYSIQYNVKMTDIESLSVDDMIKEMKTANALEKEGWVLNIDGHKVKVKCDDYCNVHRILDRASSINVVIKSIADNTFDDLISKVPEQLRNRVSFIRKLLLDFVVEKENSILDYYNKAPKDCRKDFMTWVDKNVPKNYSGFVKNKFLGKEYNLLKRRGGYIRFNKIYDRPFEYYYAKELEDKKQ